MKTRRAQILRGHKFDHVAAALSPNQMGDPRS